MSRRIDLVFPRFKVLSGAERLILELARALRARGHRPRLLCHRFHPSCRPLVAAGVPVLESGARLDFFRNRYLNAAFDYLRTPALARLIDPSSEAAVLYGPALWLVRSRRLPARVVYHCFEPPRVLYQDRDAILARAGAARPALRLALALYRGVDRRLVARAGAITASGPYAAARVGLVYGRPAVPITHGIDRRRLDGVAAPAATRHDFVTVNFLHPRKRVDLVIRALAALPAPHRRATLEIVGTGPEEPSLRALASRLGVAGRVRFAGFVDEAALPAHYRAGRCYVHAAREESFGLSVIEAAYCGLPVVAVAEGGVVDNVVDCVTGRLVEATPEALAAAMAEMLADPDAARRMGAAGRAHVDARYDWDRGAADLLGAIDAAL